VFVLQAKAKASDIKLVFHSSSETEVKSEIRIPAVLVAPPSDLVSKSFGVGCHRSEHNV